MDTDPDYKENQRNAQRKWQERNPDYWRKYRKNRHNPPPAEPVRQPVKMDTLPPTLHLVPGKYEFAFLLPPDSKMDAIRIKIIVDPESYPDANKDSIAFSLTSSYDTKAKMHLKV